MIVILQRHLVTPCIMEALPKSKRLIKYVDFQSDQFKANFEKTQKKLVGIPVKGNSPWTGRGNLWYFTTKK